LSAFTRYKPSIILLLIIAFVGGSVWYYFEYESLTLATSSVDGTEVKIGNQIWSIENLDVAEFRNGDPIPEAKTEGQWKAFVLAGEPAWCSCISDSFNISYQKGKLYNFYAVVDRRGLAPQGWRIPSSDDWKFLFDNLGSEFRAGSKLKSSDTWSADGIGTNSSGFAGKPFCKRSPSGVIDYNNGFVYWWSSTGDVNDNAWYSSLTNSGAAYRGFSHKGCGYPIRCIRE